MGKPIDEKAAAAEDAGKDRFKEAVDDGLDFGEMEEAEAFARMVEDPLVKIK